MHGFIERWNAADLAGHGLYGFAESSICAVKDSKNSTDLRGTKSCFPFVHLQVFFLISSDRRRWSRQQIYIQFGYIIVVALLCFSFFEPSSDLEKLNGWPAEMKRISND